MDHRSELSQLRHAIADQGLIIARELEAGRATAPFQEKFTFLRGDPVLPVRAAVISSHPDALHLLLSEIIGQEYNVCKVVIPSRLGFSEVLLQERGFLLDTGAGSREFDDAGSFLSALEQTHALQQTDTSNLEPLKLKLTGPAHLNGLCLLVPHSLETLERKPALLSTLADQADWVFLVGTPQTKLTPEQRQTVQLVLDNVTGLQNVMPPADPATPASPAEEWWKGWKVSLSLGLVRTGSETLRTRLAMLTAPSSELRQYLVESRLLRQLDTALALIAEELQQSQRMIGSKINLAKEGLSPGATTPDTRKSAEAIRTRLGDEVESLLRSVERDAKAVLSPDGEVNRRLLAGAEAITIDDIEQTPTELTIKLTLDEQVSHRFADLLATSAQARLTHDLQLIREGFECSVRDTEKAIESATGLRHKLTFALPDETDIRSALGNVNRPEIRYRSEMPRPTLGSRFNAARQSIMGLMIIGTMLGGAAALTGGSNSGGGMRLLLTGLMLPLMVVGFLWTYVSFRKRERLTLDKEVERLHEGVFAELRRVMQELLREQQTALNQVLQKSVRALHQQIDAAFAQTEQQRTRDAELQRKRAGDQQRSLEQRTTRLRDFTRDIAALQTRLTTADRTRATWLASWIDRFNQGKL